MKRIPLTQRQFALVDDEDYEWLNQWKWHAAYRPQLKDYIAARTIRRRGKHNLFMHRVIMGVSSSSVDVDHKNHNGLDDRRQNLRTCNQSQNSANSIRHITKTSKFKGVCRQGKKWRTTISQNYKQIHLGYYDNEIKAAKVYDKKARELFGEFAYLNFREE